MKRNTTTAAAVLSMGLMLVSCSPKTASSCTAAETATTEPATVETPYVAIRTDVPNKAFYKDIFIHGGLSLDSYIDLPAFTELNLSREYVALSSATKEAIEIQAALFSGTPEDVNGVLLYPDGEPRFRMIYVNGGGANSSGRRLQYKGRLNFKKFFENGGCYMGSCAGAYLVSISEDRTAFPGYVGIWPGDCSGALTPNWYISYDIPKDSPLLKYYDFGGDYHVDTVRHHNGAYFERWYEVPGTEALAINNYPDYMFHGCASVIAYKPNCFTGRACPIGGHPERIPSGETYKLMESIVRYTLDGQGCAKAKGILVNGEMRKMTKSTEDEDPAHTKIGDKQCHHFAFSLPKKARNIVVRLESLEDYELSLRLANGTFAFKEDAQYASEGKSLVKELRFDELEAGTWYIGVQCESTVMATETPTHVAYENTGILNGAPYTISVKWDMVETGKATLARGVNVCEMIKQSYNPNMLAPGLDTTITKVVFETGSKSTAGMRVDDRQLSEEPIFATVKDGVLTFSTPAAKIGTGEEAGFLFTGFTKLKSIEGLDRIDAEGARSFGEMFRNCYSLESVDFRGFKCKRLEAIDGMFHCCRSIKTLDLSNFATSYKIKPGQLFRGMPNLTEINLGKMKYNSYELYSEFRIFADKKDKGNNRTCSQSGRLTIRCTPDMAAFLAKSDLRNLRSGNSGQTPVEVHFYNEADGSEIFPEWK